MSVDFTISDREDGVALIKGPAPEFVGLTSILIVYPWMSSKYSNDRSAVPFPFLVTFTSDIGIIDFTLTILEKSTESQKTKSFGKYSNKI